MGAACAYLRRLHAQEPIAHPPLRVAPGQSHHILRSVVQHSIAQHGIASKQTCVLLYTSRPMQRSAGSEH